MLKNEALVRFWGYSEDPIDLNLKILWIRCRNYKERFAERTRSVSLSRREDGQTDE